MNTSAVKNFYCDIWKLQCNLNWRKNYREIGLSPVHHNGLFFLGHITTQITVALNIEHTPNALPKYICSHVAKVVKRKYPFVKQPRTNSNTRE